MPGGVEQGRVRRFMAFGYGVVCYASFGAAFCYMVLFLANVGVWPSIDRGPQRPLAVALAIDLALVALFGVQHSLMARRSFKRWWTRIVPEPLERSTYVLASNLCFVAIFAWWSPIPAEVWRVDAQWAIAACWVAYGAGFVFLVVATFAIDHFELFGLRQVYCYLRGTKMPEPVFKVPSLYKVVRHPMQLGVLVAAWAAPTMTVGHVVFSAGMSAYVLIGLRFEERDLIADFGDAYVAYRRAVGMLLPRPARRR